jgi:dCMP deaminase
MEGFSIGQDKPGLILSPHIELPKTTMYDSHMETRPPKDQYYLNIAKVVSTRSTCLKVMIGAIIVKEDQIIATGYVGAPRNTKSSLEHGFCLRQKLQIASGTQYELCRSVHAEQNAIINAARAGVSLLGGDMYIYGENQERQEILFAFPCFICKKMIINAGMRRVIVSAPETAAPLRIFQTADWVREWQAQDIIEDSLRYGQSCK